MTEPTAPYDPAEHPVDDVLAHLAEADPTERARVLTAEQDGKGRKGVLAEPVDPAAVETPVPESGDLPAGASLAEPHDGYPAAE